MSIPVVPAIIPASLDALDKHLERLDFAQEIQLDLVDGRFVPTASWPYEPAGDPLDVKTWFDKFTLEVDLMVQDPIAAAQKWVIAGADMLVFHLESLERETFKQFVSESTVSVGVAAHGATTIETIKEYAMHADYIQLMGIKEIGAQGQPFDTSVLERISQLRNLFPNKMISIDGSVNKETILQLKQAGANRMVAGSAIVLQDDPEAAHQALSALIN